MNSIFPLKDNDSDQNNSDGTYTLSHTHTLKGVQAYADL